MRFGSVCAGVGCIDLGLERAGLECAWQVEINPKRRSILARHWPEVPRYEDLKKVSRASDDLEPVDLLAGGTPCQDWSLAGRRAGMDGERSSLFVDFIRLADALPARWILWENVPGVLSQHEGQDFALCLEGFTGSRPGIPEDGWRSAGVATGPLRWCVWRVLDAQGFGVAQRRRRVFVVSGPRDQCRPEILLESDCLPGDSAAREEARPITSPLASGSPGGGGQRLDADNLSQLVHHVSSYGGYREGVGLLRRSGGDLGAGSETLVVDGAQLTHPENRQQPQAEHSPAVNRPGRLLAYQCHGSNVGPAGTLRSGNGNEAGGVPFVASPLTASSAKTTDSAGSGGSGPKNAIIESQGVRRLVPVEYEALMGLPRDWTRWAAGGTELADTPRYQAVGDGAAVPVLEWIGRRLKAAQ